MIVSFIQSSLLGKDGMQTYNSFLEILVRASKENMAPSKVMWCRCVVESVTGVLES